jgi:hypothetical protein
MARAFQFDVGPVVEQLNRILQMELAAIIYYTHYSFMIYGPHGFRSPPGCAITRRNRWPMLKRRVK